MQLLAQEEYGLRCLLQVARHQGSRPLTIAQVAEAEGLSPEYTAKLMRALRKGHPGLLKDCIHTPDCAVRSLWRKLEGTVRALLESITLEDLQQPEQPMLLRLELPTDAAPGLGGPGES